MRQVHQDMIADNVAFSPHTYVMLATAYGHAQNIDALEELYRQLNMETEVDINLPIYNAFMNAFQYAGYGSRSAQLWDQLILSGAPVDNTTISIILDTCGRYGYGNLAFEVWQWAQANLGVNERNIDAWQECQHRLGYSENKNENLKCLF